MISVVTRLWEYFPIPEPHVIGLLLGGVLNRYRPRKLTSYGTYARAGGWILLGIGLSLIGWALVSVSGNLDQSDRNLITTGPYTSSRHPMYVGWTVLYLGVTLLQNNRWAALLLPAVVLHTDIIVHREERLLESEFGDTYREYCRTNRKYL